MTRVPLFTVFIPTFNRADTLPRALESVEQQTLRDFEVLIVDDGSTDATRELVTNWTSGADFPVEYIHQENQGKHGAHNTALEHARGELVAILDSDDALVPQALESLAEHWHAIPETERRHFAGVEGLCIDMDTGEVAGTRYPDDVFDSTYHEIRHKYRVTGDKKGAIRTDVLREFPYPVFAGEKHVRPSLVWERMSLRYKVRYVNVPIQRIQYQAGGLSSDRFGLRLRNPNGYSLYFREAAEIFHRDAPIGLRRQLMTNHVRYALHAGIGPVRQWNRVTAHGLWMLAFPAGWLKRQSDRIRQRARQRKSGR